MSQTGEINKNNTSQAGEINIGTEKEASSTVKMAQHIGTGQMPHNDMIVASMKELETPLNEQAQSKTGPEARIAQHTQNLVQHTREMFQEKNADNSLQSIHAHAKEAANALAEGTKEGHSETIGAEQGKWSEERVLELRNLLQAFRKTATSLARNNSFRSDLIEAVHLMQTLIFDLTQTTLDKKLTEAKSKVNQETTTSTTTNQTTAPTTVQQTTAPTTSTHSQTTPSATPPAHTETAPSVTDAQPSTFTVPLTHVGSHTTEHTAERPRGHIEKVETPTQGSSSDNKPALSEEERKHAFEKLRKLMIHLGQTPEYKDLIEQLMNFFQHNGSQMAHIATSGKESSQSALRALADDIQQLIERFSGDVSLTPLREHIGAITVSVQKDPQVQKFFNDLRAIIRETIENPENKHPEELDVKFQELSQKGRDLLKKPEYRDDWNITLNGFRDLLGRIKEDTHLQRLGSDFEGLRREIMLNDKGQLDFGQVRQSLPALKNVLVPTLTSAVKTIPVTPIKSDDEKYYLEVSNLSLSAQDLVPENLNLYFANDLYFDFSGTNADRFDSALSVSMNEFKATLRDLSFKYERKKMPRMTDEGVADIEIVGMTLKFRWLMEKEHDKLTFTCDKVRCQIRELNTTIKEAQHKMLDKIALKLFNTQIKRGIEQSTESALKEKLSKFSIDTSSGVPVKEQLKNISSSHPTQPSSSIQG